MTKFAVIGVGPWGIKVAAAIKALGFECGAISGRQGITTFEYNEIIQWADIVFIATHPVCCVEMARHALSNGKLTIVEKPVGFDAHEVKELIELSRANKVPLIVDYTYLFNPAVMALKRPDLRSLSITMGSNGPVRDYSVLWDWGSHAVAIALDFIQEPLTKIAVLPCDSGRYMVDLLFGTKAATITVANNLDERTVRISGAYGLGPGKVDSFEDTDRYNKVANPLAALISTAARLHLRGEYFTNGALAVEVTDVLERLHAMLPTPIKSPTTLECGLSSRLK